MGDSTRLQSIKRRGDSPRDYYIFCDESGVSGNRHYGFGSLWMPHQRRGDFSALMQGLRTTHGYKHEIKWQKVSRRHQAFYEALVDEFFRRRWLMFHCLVVRKSYVDKSKHRGSYDLARRKHFTMLLSKKIRRYARPNKRYFVRVDPIASSYGKAHEVVESITNHTVRQELGLRPVDSVVEVDSKETPGIQLCDLLTGAVLDGFERDSSSPHKQAVRRRIAHNLGWDDLDADTRPKESKFNVWYFFDPTDGTKREVRTRSVRLRFAFP